MSSERRPQSLNVVRVYHAGRDPAHRERERALRVAGVDVTLVVPAFWPEYGGETTLSVDSFPTIELPVERAGDANRHAYRDQIGRASCRERV